MISSSGLADKSAVAAVNRALLWLGGRGCDPWGPTDGRINLFIGIIGPYGFHRFREGID